MAAADKNQCQDPENQPLLDETEEEDDDSMSYDARKLVTFDVFFNLSGTVWTKYSLWKQMGMLVLCSLTTGCVVAFSVKDPSKLDTSKFATISQFLSVIVGLLLGFFLSSAVNRWYSCTNGFLSLFDAIRGLQMQLGALGVPQERLRMVLRYGLVSCYCLTNDLYRDALPAKERQQFTREKWEELTITEGKYKAWEKGTGLARVFPEERSTLEKVEDPSQTLWVWITSLLTRMSADGEIPPMPTPTYGRVIAIAEAAYNGIREVRASVTVQPPYVYVQMLAMLVTLNNIITAVSFGMTLGVNVGMLVNQNAKVLGIKTEVETDNSAAGRGLQDLAIAFVMSTIGPFLYQALLEVAVCIAQPFASGGSKTPGSIPTAKLLQNMERDLRDADMMSSDLPWWDKPHFKPPLPAGYKRASIC
eukprot:TRINITY_DN83_c2_g3_i1.p1 TRINITY_DN83_c2_g3~~TRINITY_DN83_c2_g3_i1.p1  ORF type:complete len:418 (+),score=100.65 TRINITY_DN83_c2_g3_i1:147-1400(+)